MPERIEIMPTRAGPLVSTVFWFAEAVLGLGLGGYGLSIAGREHGFLTATLLAGSALLVLFGVVMGAVSLAILRLDGPAIVMNAAGFRDLRLSDQTVPWKAMRWGMFSSGRGGRSLQFDVGDGMDYRTTWPHRILGAINRTFRHPPHTVMTLGTGKSVQELAEMISVFRKPTR